LTGDQAKKGLKQKNEGQEEGTKISTGKHESDRTRGFDKEALMGRELQIGMTGIWEREPS